MTCQQNGGLWLETDSIDIGILTMQDTPFIGDSGRSNSSWGELQGGADTRCLTVIQYIERGAVQAIKILVIHKSVVRRSSTRHERCGSLLSTIDQMGEMNSGLKRLFA